MRQGPLKGHMINLASSTHAHIQDRSSEKSVQLMGSSSKTTYYMRG